jgi:methyl-galactoside transport system substrate-binding protein
MKRLIAMLLTIILCLSMAGCGEPFKAGSQETVTDSIGDTENTAESTLETVQRIVKVGVSIYNFDDPFMLNARYEFEEYLSSKSGDLTKYEITILDSKADQYMQIEQIKGFIEQNVDVLIVTLVSETTFNSFDSIYVTAPEIISMAKAADIPVIFLNSEPSKEDMQLWDKISYIGFDQRDAGTAQGEIIRDLPDNGDINGDGVVKYVIIMGDSENSFDLYRKEYSIKALTDDGIQIKELLVQDSGWERSKAEEIAAEAIVKFGSDIDVIFCSNDGIAVGAYKTIEDAGLTVGSDIYLVGMDAIPEGIEMLEKGQLTGTVKQDPILLAHAAADVVSSIANGSPIEKYTYVDFTKITK